MEATLHALGGVLLKAVPTFLLVFLLTFYLRIVFYGPLEKVLRQRWEATEGARQAAGQSLERASARAAEYEAAMRAARAEVYQRQEQLHRELLEREAAELATARQRAEGAVRDAKTRLAQDMEEAKAGLARDSDLLADQIVESILRRSAA